MGEAVQEARKFVAYYRVSTKEQGRSGLGLEGQRDAVQRFINGGGRLVAEFTEVESGTRKDRPELAKAIQRAKVTGSRLLVAKLDRLSRNASFTSQLRDAGCKFVCCDMPDANELTIGILAHVAQDEAKRISDRTKAALAVKREQLAKEGKRLGSPKGADHLRGLGNEAAVATVKAKAAGRVADLAETIADIRASGHLSVRAIAAELNARDIVTARGGRWQPSSVAALLARMDGGVDATGT